MKPMYQWPDADAPATEWRTPSATLESPRAVALFTGQQLPPRKQNVSPVKVRKRAAKIDGPRAVAMRAEGYKVRDIATVLGVSSRAVERALKKDREERNV